MPTEEQIEAAHAVLRERNCFVPWEDLAAALEAAADDAASVLHDHYSARADQLRDHYLAHREDDHLTWLRDRIAAKFGGRCEEDMHGCCVCDAWALYDALSGG